MKAMAAAPIDSQTCAIPVGLRQSHNHTLCHRDNIIDSIAEEDSSFKSIWTDCEKCVKKPL